MATHSAGSTSDRVTADKRPSLATGFGHSGVGCASEAAVEPAGIEVESSAKADVRETMWVRQLPVGFLPFARRWLPMSGLKVS